MQGAGECLSCEEGTTSLIGAAKCEKPPAEEEPAVDAALDEPPLESASVQDPEVSPPLPPFPSPEDGSAKDMDAATPEENKAMGEKLAAQEKKSGDSDRMDVMDAAAALNEHAEEKKDITKILAGDSQDAPSEELNRDGRRLSCSNQYNEYVRISFSFSFSLFFTAFVLSDDLTAPFCTNFFFQQYCGSYFASCGKGCSTYYPAMCYLCQCPPGQYQPGGGYYGGKYQCSSCPGGEHTLEHWCTFSLTSHCHNPPAPDTSHQGNTNP
jgi:hypothetical protein